MCLPCLALLPCCTGAAVGAYKINKSISKAFSGGDNQQQQPPQEPVDSVLSTELKLNWKVGRDVGGEGCEVWCGWGSGIKCTPLSHMVCSDCMLFCECCCCEVPGGNNSASNTVERTCCRRPPAHVGEPVHKQPPPLPFHPTHSCLQLANIKPGTATAAPNQEDAPSRSLSRKISKKDAATKARLAELIEQNKASGSK
jgi:hypothetical protein